MKKEKINEWGRCNLCYKYWLSDLLNTCGFEFIDKFVTLCPECRLSNWYEYY